ncbi:MAG: winged helix-turn-helix domain-containing protein [Planctomycetota bacterium]
MSRQEPVPPVAAGQSQPIRIGAWVLTPTLQILEHPVHGARSLRRKLVQVLECLAERPGELVPRDELLERIWPGRIVNEESLTRAISELRTIFGDDAAAPRYIHTIRGRGYRLVAEVGGATAAAVGAESPATSGRAVAAGSWRLLASAGAVVAILLAWSLGAQLRSGARVAEIDPAEPRPLTFFPGRETDPAVSPDGSRVAFAWGGADDTNYDIYVKPRDGDRVRRLTRDAGRDVHPAWSPDGRRIAFLRNGETGASAWVVDAMGGDPERVGAVGAWATGLDWSPDGAALILAHIGDGISLRLARLRIADGGLAAISAPGEGERDHSPVWSPSGERIAFVRTGGPSHRDQVCVANADGADLRRFDMQLRQVRGLDWVADERHLILAAQERGTGRLYRMATRDGTLDELHVREEHITYPSLSDDARTLAYEDARPRQRVWRLGVAAVGAGGAIAARAEPFLETSHNQREAYFSADGARIAFISDRSGDLELWIADAAGRDCRRVTATGADVVRNPRWAPAGDRIAYQRTSSGSSSLWVLTLRPTGTETAKVYEDAGDLQLCGWAHGGAALYFGARHGDGAWRVWQLAVGNEAASPQLVAGDGMRTVQESADGAWLYYSTDDAPGVWRRPLAGGTAALVWADVDARFGDHWLVSGDRLFCAHATGAAAVVRQAHLESGTSEVLFETRRLHAPSLSFSPRTQELLLTTRHEGDADLDVVELLPLAFAR